MLEPKRILRAGRFALALDRPLIMGIVNVTPDSFSDGGRYLDPGKAIARGRQLIEEGADLLDIGGESTRPGATPVPVEEEAARILPVLDALRDVPVPLSVDTWKPEVMRLALEHGAALVNDVNALLAPGALELVAAWECGVCLMHKQGDPQTMQRAPAYADVVAEVRQFLADRVEACQDAGIASTRLVIDPGFGFGKTAAHNLALLRALPVLAGLGAPVLVGLSRKSLVGGITGRAPQDRTIGSVAGALLAAERGAAIVRVHDVAATRDALRVLQAVTDEREEGRS